MMMNDPTITARTRKTERQLALLFADETPFSTHLQKWSDPFLPDKYDHNCFSFGSTPPQPAEIAAAKAFQRLHGCRFLKLEGDVPLEEHGGLEESVTLTMVLCGGFANWNTNPDVTVRKPDLAALEALEVRAFGKSWGEDFCRRNIRRLYESLTYHGAYVGQTLAGACYSFTFDGCTCIDGLVTDAAFRNRLVATTLLASVAAAHPDDLIFLHADANDTPKTMYEKRGFRAVDQLFEYLTTDL